MRIDEIEKLQKEIEPLQARQQELAIAVVADTRTYSLDKRFRVWSKYVIKKEKSWIIDATEYPIIGKMVDDCYPYDYDRYRTYDWQWFLDTAVDIFEEYQDPACRDPKARFTTQESIDAIKEEMMRLNFGSFMMDW